MLGLSINYVYVQNDTAFGIGDAVVLMKQPGEASGGIAVIQAIWEDKPTHGEVKQQACCRRYFRADVRHLIALTSEINLNEQPQEWTTYSAWIRNAYESHANYWILHFADIV